MLQSHTRDIDGLEVTVVELPARVAIKLGAKLARTIGPALARTKGIDMASDIATLAPALFTLGESLDDKTFDELLLEVFKQTSVIADGRKTELTTIAKIDSTFGANKTALMKAAAFTVEVNFGDFFAGLKRSKPETAASP